MLSPKIIFEDASFLVVDKPAGVVVSRADTTANVETIQDWVERKFEIQNSKFKNADEFVNRAGIVHRLDKDTSGLLVIAKTPKAFENLKNQFKNRETVKKYLVLVHGRVEPKEGTVEAPIGRSPFNRRHFGVFPGGRESETSYRVTKLLSNLVTDFSFLEVYPKTGRTHQIRVHLKYINHPVVADPVYAGRKNYQADITWCPRIFLHAAFLSFNHPLDGTNMEFNSPLPKDLKTALDLLNEENSPTI